MKSVSYLQTIVTNSDLSYRGVNVNFTTMNLKCLNYNFAWQAINTFEIIVTTETILSNY